MDKKHTRRKKISDNAKATLLRWWIVGMCYFMIGFGTQAGGYTSPIDLIFFLGVGIGLVTIVVYNPIAYNVFDIVRGGEIVNHRYRNKKGWQRALQTLGDLGLSMLVVILVYLSYQNINLFLVGLLGLSPETVTNGGGIGASIYAASKGAVQSYSRALAKDLAEFGIRVNMVSPGTIDTPFHAATDRKLVESWKDSILMKRLGEPREVADVIEFLASDKASFLTGEVIQINGGQAFI